MINSIHFLHCPTVIRLTNRGFDCHEEMKQCVASPFRCFCLENHVRRTHLARHASEYSRWPAPVGQQGSVRPAFFGLSGSWSQTSDSGHLKIETWGNLIQANVSIAHDEGEFQTRDQRPPDVNVMLNCRQLSRLISDFSDRPHSLRERIELWLHVSMCGSCGMYRRLQARLNHVMRVRSIGVDEEEPVPHMPESSRERIRVAVKTELSRHDSASKN